MKFIRAVFAILWKDLLSEKRTIATLGSMLIFALVVIFIFVFAFDLAVDERSRAATGVIWVAICFAGTLSLDRTMACESESGGMEGLLLAPFDRTVIFAAKVLVNWIFMLVTAVIVIAAYSVFNNVSLFSFGFLGVVLLGTLGYLLIGTLIATLTHQLKARGMLLPVLLFPLLIPLLLAAVNASDLVIFGGNPGTLRTWLGVLAGYDLLFLATGVLVFDKILEE